jgi:hypothetical protein
MKFGVGINCWADITFLCYPSDKDIQLGLSPDIGYQIFYKKKLKYLS